MWSLPRPGPEPMYPCIGRRSLKHKTTREAPQYGIFMSVGSFVLKMYDCAFNWWNSSDCLRVCLPVYSPQFDLNKIPSFWLLIELLPQGHAGGESGGQTMPVQLSRPGPHSLQTGPGRRPGSEPQAAFDTPLHFAFSTPPLITRQPCCFSSKLNRSLLVLPLPWLIQEQQHSSQLSTCFQTAQERAPVHQPQEACQGSAECAP